MQGQTPCRVATFNSTGLIKILAADNVIKVSIEVVTAPVVMTGNARFPNTAAGTPIPSAPISLAAGTVFTFSSGGPEAPIDNLQFDATGGGSCNFVMQM